MIWIYLSCLPYIFTLLSSDYILHGLFWFLPSLLCFSLFWPVPSPPSLSISPHPLSHFFLSPLLLPSLTFFSFFLFPHYPPTIHKFLTACEVNFGCRIDRTNSLPPRGKALLPAHVPVSVGDKLRVLYGPNAKESKVTYEAKVREGNLLV